MDYDPLVTLCRIVSIKELTLIVYPRDHSERHKKYFIPEIPPIIPSIGDYFSCADVIRYRIEEPDTLVQIHTEIIGVRITGRHLGKDRNGNWYLHLNGSE